MLRVHFLFTFIYLFFFTSLTLVERTGSIISLNNSRTVFYLAETFLELQQQNWVKDVPHFLGADRQAGDTQLSVLSLFCVILLAGSKGNKLLNKSCLIFDL